jgi:hypothetical protein
LRNIFVQRRHQNFSCAIMKDIAMYITIPPAKTKCVPSCTLFRKYARFRPPFRDSSGKMGKYFSYESSCGHILTTKRLIFFNRRSCYEDDFIVVFDFQWTWSGIRMYKLSCLKQISVSLVAFAIVPGLSIWYLERLLLDTEVLTRQLYITERTNNCLTRDVFCTWPNTTIYYFYKALPHIHQSRDEQLVTH